MKRLVTASIGILGYEHNQSQPVVRLWNDFGALIAMQQSA
jgi:hypothetical protein